MCHVREKIVLENHTLLFAATLALCPVPVLCLVSSCAFTTVPHASFIQVIRHIHIHAHEYPSITTSTLKITLSSSVQ
jgi:hypothetical protein